MIDHLVALEVGGGDLVVLWQEMVEDSEDVEVLFLEGVMEGTTMAMEEDGEDRAVVAVVAEAWVAEGDFVIRDEVAGVVILDLCPPLVTLCTCEDCLLQQKKVM